MSTENGPSKLDRVTDAFVYSKNQLLAMGGAVAAFALGGAMLDTISSNPSQPNVTPGSPLHLASCPQPTAESISLVQKLFSEPVAKAREQANLGRLTYASSIDYATNVMYGGDASDELAEANDFMQKNYGVDVELGWPDGKTHGGVRTPTSAELTKNYAYDYVNRGLVEAMTDVPKQLIAFSGFKHFREVYSDSIGVAQVEFPDTIDWNVKYDVFVDNVSDALGAPLGYLLENKICSYQGMNNDPGFAKLSGKNIYTNQGASNDGLVVMGDTWEKEATMTQDWLKNTNESRADYCTNWRAIKKLAGRAVALQHSSLDDLAADKAEFATLVTAPWNNRTVMGKDEPLLKKKGTYFLAQLSDALGSKGPALLANVAVSAGEWSDTTSWGKKHITPPVSRFHNQIYGHPQIKCD